MGSEIQSCLRLSKGVRYRTHGAQRRQGRLNKTLEVSFHEEIQFEIKTVSGTLYSKTGLLRQLIPSLEMTFALRMFFDIPGGEDRILNMDESQIYRYDESSRAWTF